MVCGERAKLLIWPWRPCERKNGNPQYPGKDQPGKPLGEVVGKNGLYYIGIEACNSEGELKTIRETSNAGKSWLVKTTYIGDIL